MKYKEIAALFEHSQNLHYYCNSNTYELEYINPKMCEFLNINPNDYYEKKCYEIIYNQNTPCNVCINHELDGTFTNTETSKCLCNIKFKSVNSIIETDNPNISLNVGNLILFEDNEETLFYKHMLDFMRIYKKAENFDKSVEKMLEIIGNYYQCDGAGVFKIQKGTDDFGCAYNFNNKNSDFDLSKLNINSKEISRWLLNFENSKDIIIDNIDNLKDFKEEYDLLTKINTNNLLAVAINLQENIQGFIVIINPNKSRNNNTFLYLMSSFIQDNLNRHDLLRKLKIHSDLDRLTGCYNSSSYFNRLVTFKSNPPNRLGVVFCDINGLREYNERYGYEYGDTLILNSAQIMKQYFNEPFYRIGGDEFVCFVETLNEDEFHNQVAGLRKETLTNEKACFSVGCTWNIENIDVSKQVATADSLMYLNKQKYYKNAKEAVSNQSSNILGDLLEAIEKDEFLVFLQPKIDLVNDEVIGAEALVRRFDSKSGKLVFPDNFIPMYEDEGIIRHVDLNVLDKVCKMLQEWIKLGKSLKIAVNFSRVTLKEDGIVETIVKICDKYEIPHNLIVVEITERIGLMDSEVSNKLITDFKKLGFQLSLDDFGCAYSNIVTLSKIDVDEVKIDKSLIDYVESNNKNKIIVQSIIDMCNRMESTTTISEGIETQTQAELLKLFKCTHGQGYLYSRPIPVLDFYNKYINI